MNLDEVRRRLEAADRTRYAAEQLFAEERRALTSTTGESKGSIGVVMCICGAEWDHMKPKDESHELGCPAEELRNIAQELEAPIRRAVAEV